MPKRIWNIILLAGFFSLVGCNSAAQPVEVTRVVSQEVPVTVEVTRLVSQEVAQEVTREVVVEVTRLVTETPTAEPTMTATASAEPTATTISGATYIVQRGDTLAIIAAFTGVDAATIQTANNIANPNQIYAGQVLIIPGWNGNGSGSGQSTAPPATLPPTSVPATLAPTATTSAPQVINLLPNPSFEGDWYFAGYNELQIPVGWQVSVDEGPNNLQPGSGGNFLRPEIRVVSNNDLPPDEHALFIFDGVKTVKAFKGGAPTSFALFTDITLPPGSYRFRIQFFPDTVIAYENGVKIFSPDPLAAETRIIFNNGGTGWQGTVSGQRNALTYDFTLTSEQTVRLGAAFRNRYVMANNSWFLDDWSLVALTP